VARGESAKKKKKLITIEAGISMKTNKTTKICPAKKRHFCLTKRQFIQRHPFFAEIDGFFVTNAALGNELHASKWRSSKWRLPAAIEPPRRRRATIKSGRHANLGEVVAPTASAKLNCRPGFQGGAMETPLNAMMYKKPKGIAVRRETHRECMSLKTKDLAYAQVARVIMERACGK
jgi:hypothetical protein